MTRQFLCCFLNPIVIADSPISRFTTHKSIKTKNIYEMQEKKAFKRDFQSKSFNLFVDNNSFSLIEKHSIVFIIK